jgi:CheY-like chemotaxis protein
MGNAKIMIVDDDPDYINVVKTILENEQYTVITAGDKTEGMEKIKAEKPDLAILDVMMDAWQDGFEMSRQLKKDSQFKNLPILLLTGVDKKTGIDFKSTAPDPVWLPVDVYIDKPVEPQVLLTEVKKLLSSKAEDRIGIQKYKTSQKSLLANQAKVDNRLGHLKSIS